MNIINAQELNEVDKNKLFWNPGCAINIYKPELSIKIFELLSNHLTGIQLHKICCHHEPNLEEESVIINNCSGCDRRFRNLYRGISTISLWEVLDSIDNLALPNHHGLVLSVHDSCSYRERPTELASLRNILEKMKIKIIESEFSGKNSICCGDDFYEKVTLERLHALQRKRASQMPCQDVAVQCISCMKSMAIGGKRPRYIPDLIFNQETEPGSLDMVKYHDELQSFIDSH